MKRRRHTHPLHRLALALGVAARNISDPRFRKLAVDAAESIPVCNSEIGGGRRGEMARLGRKTLKGLMEAPPEQFAELAEVMRGCRDAILSRFEVTSEVSLADKHRRRREAA